MNKEILKQFVKDKELHGIDVEYYIAPEKLYAHLRDNLTDYFEEEGDLDYFFENWIGDLQYYQSKEFFDDFCFNLVVNSEPQNLLGYDPWEVHRLIKRFLGNNLSMRYDEGDGAKQIVAATSLEDCKYEYDKERFISDEPSLIPCGEPKKRFLPGGTPRRATEVRGRRRVVKA